MGCCLEAVHSWYDDVFGTVDLLPSTDARATRGRSPSREPIVSSHIQRSYTSDLNVQFREFHQQNSSSRNNTLQISRSQNHNLSNRTTTNNQRLFPTQQQNNELTAVHQQQYDIRSRNVHKPGTKIAKNLISDGELCKYLPETWKKNINSDFIFQVLDKNSIEYRNINKLIQRTTKNNLKIEFIHRVENKYLLLMYELKSEEIAQLYGYCNELQLFHGTKEKNITAICSNNFNWRYYGKNKGHIFGQGVSFSPLASYASHYTNENEGKGNKMILAKVAYFDHCEGNKSMVLPTTGCDTATNAERKVYVKFDDHTFYPEYVITYAGKLPHVNKQNLENMRSRSRSRGREVANDNW